jgi:DNA-binding GntR family transcriptional regulator
MAPDKPANLAELAYTALEARLVTLHWPPGALLQEKDLAQAIGIGRTPVREAVQRLAGQGLLKILPRKGLLVAPVQRSELLQIIEVRRVLERLLVVKAAERASPQQRDTLAGLAAQFATVGEELDQYMRLDRALDAALGEACANPYLAAALAPLHAHCRRFWFLRRERLDLARAVALHAGLADAAARADGSGAIRALNGIIAVLEEQLGALDVIS